MVRNYKRKNNKDKKYSSDTLQKAIDDVSKGFSVRSVSNKYEVPFSTLLHTKKRN